MADEQKCPTCGSQDAGRLTPSDWVHCGECGTIWVKSRPDILTVPRRAQPPEVKEQPDEPGWWWVWRENDWWLVRHSEDNPATDEGRYYKVPMPPPPQRSDADILREAADRLREAPYDKLSEAVLRIAESLKRSEHG